MIPQAENLNIIYQEEQQKQMPSKTFYLNFAKNRIEGNLDGMGAIKQSIMNMLLTERYAYVIHSWNYGASVEKYLGQSYAYAVADMGREIKETLLTDDRILDVYDFSFAQEGESLLVSFRVDTLEGSLEMEVNF